MVAHVCISSVAITTKKAKKSGFSGLLCFLPTFFPSSILPSALYFPLIRLLLKQRVSIQWVREVYWSHQNVPQLSHRWHHTYLYGWSDGRILRCWDFSGKGLGLKFIEIQCEFFLIVPISSLARLKFLEFQEYWALFDFRIRFELWAPSPVNIVILPVQILCSPRCFKK